jgi:hypothetical protein
MERRERLKDGVLRIESSESRLKTVDRLRLPQADSPHILGVEGVRVNVLHAGGDTAPSISLNTPGNCDATTASV